jgi:hypothetical protein
VEKRAEADRSKLLPAPLAEPDEDDDTEEESE